MSRTKTRQHHRKPAQPKSTAAPKLPALDTRNRRPFITDIQIRAAYAAALAGVTYTRITGWEHQDDDTVRYAMPSGAALTYNPDADIPLTAWTPCPRGVRHPHPLATRADLMTAQIDAAQCTDPHTTDADQADALTRGVQPLTPDPADTEPIARIPQPDDTIPVVLADTLTKSPTSSDDTVHTDVAALRADVTDTDAPKEHPDHG
ncbi:hypothetical protein AB0D12_32020 [Streptomyces sp. NPDC048479]|uniref:hypothetical protein n=1 Tax=Streptomyces sp. NPDC048479 TaxID=3154725 RepID=UPI003448726C